MKILSLGTYPIRNPRHGGQKRVAALARQHRAMGHQYLYVAAYPAGAYGANEVSTMDFAVSAPDTLGGGWASDLSSGRFCAADEDAFTHFRDICTALGPDAIVLEQPFLWPIAKRLLSMPEFEDVRIVYSSHNIEAPLKQSVLTGAGVSPASVRAIVEATDELERDLVGRSDLIVAVSVAEAADYSRMEPKAKVVVRANGIDPVLLDSQPRSPFLPLPYLMFVGSAHLPNRDGFLDLILGDGLQFLAPEKALAVVGGVSDLIYGSELFQRRVVSNCDRVQFFPNVTEAELSALIQNADGFILPILTGGGTNLKTAEALSSGKWVIGTDSAFRGYEAFRTEPNVLIANSRTEFIDQIRKTLAEPAQDLELAAIDKRRQVLWPNILEGFDLESALESPPQ